MKKNVIVLTHGWTGSSVFSALFGRAGYWLGSETMRKPDYDTHENADLVGLNRRLLETGLPGVDHEHRFAFEDVHALDRATRELDLAPHADFLARCHANAPWLWKDPRLTWTIRVWARLLDPATTAYLVLTRDDRQAWISANTRRHIQSMAYTRAYNHGITQSNLDFLHGAGLPCLKTSFEDLLLAPDQTLARLNGAFDLALTMSDLTQVCREPLHRKSRGVGDLVKAALIYAKNYHERDGRGRRDAATKRLMLQP
ncbi:MAG: hypothetical protein JSR59_13710 [Proteobacteria bacterium]|nr:hypothetical protein [Pseudomonadota bacterium]